MADNGKFKYSYSAPTEEERRQIEEIRRDYIIEERRESDFDKLKKLHEKVKRPATVTALCTGCAGLLMFGLGMSMVLCWDLWIWGSAVALVGAAPIALANAIYNAVLKRQKKKYGEEIVKLSDELLRGNK